jgi:hypothetical protein
MTTRQMLVVWLIALSAMAASTSSLQAFSLITQDEAARERMKGKTRGFSAASSGNSGRPQIFLVSPSKLSGIPSPLDIELRFIPAAPSKIVGKSFRALYGFCAFDVTDRLTKHAEVTPTGILAKNAELPGGSHSITIQISDDRDRVGSKTFRFEIVV